MVTGGQASESLEYPLGFPSPERQRLFLDYLNAKFRVVYTSGSGTFERREDGSSISVIQGTFSFGDQPLNLRWELIGFDSKHDKRLSINPLGPETPPGNWKDLVGGLVTSVLTATLAEETQTFFQRRLFFYVGQQLDGEYWLPGFRFAPALPDDSDPYRMDLERAVVIDQRIEAIDWLHAIALADEKAQRIAARMSLLLGAGLYRIDSDYAMRWVNPTDSNSGEASKSVRCHRGFNLEEAGATSMPEKGASCRLGECKGDLTRTIGQGGVMLSLPREVRRIFKGIDDNSDPTVAEALDRAARLYQVALVCGRQFPSVGMAYRVAAVEAITKTTSGSKSFSEFMKMHLASEPGLDELLDYLYGDVRSAHFHAGSFPAGEFSRLWHFDAFINSDAAEKSVHQIHCAMLTRQAIINWMIGVSSVSR